MIEIPKGTASHLILETYEDDLRARRETLVNELIALHRAGTGELSLLHGKLGALAFVDGMIKGLNRDVLNARNAEQRMIHGSANPK